MKEFELTVKAHRGAMAFIELNDDSVWEVGIIPRCKINDIDIEQLGLLQAQQKCHLYSMYRSKKLNIGYLESFNVVNSEIKQNDGAVVVLYGIVISESPLPSGKVEVLCYKKAEGIEEFPSEE